MSYAQLSTSSHHDGGHGSRGSLEGPEDSQSGVEGDNTGITIYVLHKEKKVTVRLRSLNKTLLELKHAIERECNVPEAQQRLIRNGKMLKALSSTLSELGLADECTVHLFPIPQAVAAPVINSLGTSVAVAQATNVQGMQSAEGGAYPALSLSDRVQGVSPLQIVRGETPDLNPWVQNTCREVQMWSMILMILSLLTITSNLSNFMGTGEFGDSPLDKAVFILDTLVSAGGLYVGKIGLIASRTLETEDVKKYVLYLGMLSAAAIVMRIMWTFDVVEEIKKDVRKAQAEAAKSDSGKAQSDDPISDPSSPVSDDMITTVTMQAAIISLIIIFAWSTCFIRAIRLRWALHLYDRANSTEDEEHTTSDIEGIVVVNPIGQGAANTAATATTIPSNV